MLLPRCNPLRLRTPVAMAGTAMGGLAMLAGIGPFLAGIGVGAGIVGGAALARKAMQRRSGWKDEGGDALPEGTDVVASANPI
jgi:hypothetical protein